MSKVVEELKQLRQAITDQQKQIAAQQQEIERLRQQQTKISEASANSAGASAHLVNAVGTPATTASAATSSGAEASKPQASQNPQGVTGPSQPAPTAIAAVAPIRVLPVDPPKKSGLIPDITIGKKINVKPYGFFKASAIYDTSSPYGNDFPLPGFIGDVNGPDKLPEFHLKARSLRIGANFEWLDPSPNVTVTGKFEMDFEGNFSRVNNRNISSIRSSMPSIRLGFGRVDWKAGENTTIFGVLGQDWTPFASSTLPNLFESTGLGLGFGTLYERAPQMRVGINQKLGGDRKFAIQPEFAVVLPVFGNLPTNLSDQIGYAERQGPDAGRPELQARVVTQFQLDKAPGVPPAQIIVSGVNGERSAVVLASGVPAPFQPFFPSGARVTTQRWGWTGEIQLPTRFATLTAKYYNGTDLRFYFAGQLYTQFNDTLAFIPASLVEVPSIDGASSLRMGLLAANGAPAIAPQRPARSQGGFVNLGLPLSRWFNADPKGRNAGWTMYLHAGYDQVLARDVRRLGGGRAKSRLLSGQMQYKLNDWVSFVAEESLYTTYSIPLTLGPAAGTYPKFAGRPMRQWNDFRSEIGPQFTF